MERAVPPRGDFDRRSLLKAMAASLAMSGTAGRARADERALPYVNAPEFVVPGKPKWYATPVFFAGYIQPVLGKSYVGRPVKLEGNPDHPASGGATDIFMQAALLGLYDPARSQTPLQNGQPTSWAAVERMMAEQHAKLDERQGDGLRLLTGTVTSPTLARQIGTLLKQWPKARWSMCEPVNDDNRAAAVSKVMGRTLDMRLHLDRADVVISFDDDLLGPGPRQLVQAKAWGDRRRAWHQGGTPSRLFVAEPSLTATGTTASDRLIASPLRMAPLLQALLARFGLSPIAAPGLTEAEQNWLSDVVAALDKASGRALISLGAHHPPQLHAATLLLNDRLGAVGTALDFIDPIVAQGAASIGELMDDMAAGQVTDLITLDTNPAYSVGGFSPLLEKVPFRLHAGMYVDETAQTSHWHVPLLHELESWSDGRAVDGTTGIVQPLVRPLYEGRPLHVVLDRWLGGTNNDHDIVRATWNDAWGKDFEERWRSALVAGFVAGSAPNPVSAAIANRDIPIESPSHSQDLIVDIRPDPTIWDGRFACNAWLQETPKPISKVTWDNIVLLSPRLARERNIVDGAELRIDVNGRSITGPAWIAPGQDPNTLTLTLGYGQERPGTLPHGLGYNAVDLLERGSGFLLVGAGLTPTGRHQLIATTQPEQAMDGFDFVRTVTEPHAAIERTAPQASFYPERKWDSPSWGMSIDLDLCIGCNACLVACVAENNVPMVGKELVSEGRVMHWLRIDHYHEGDPEAPDSSFQPVPCMHCEQAPCEMGCPVNATVHSPDGLNLQVYNRCIGTRTCSAYCPYKVRRFNWFEYTGGDPESIRAMRNPEVTVRSRGVMEKCTYCIQRISAARIAAKIAGQPVRDGEVVTACQQACPTEAIVFGDVTDPDSAVSRRKAGPRNYSLIEDANTRPRTTYLARVRK